MNDTFPCNHFSRTQLQHDTCPFRLLTVDEIDAQGKLSISLRQGHASHNVSYRTLSYAWNNDLPSVLVLVNGHTKYITVSLYEALRHLDAYCGRGYPLWVDQICILQDDVQDKALQVPLIGDIFKDSQEVVCWLGLSTPQIDILVSFIEPFYRSLFSNADYIEVESDELLLAAGLPLSNDVIWQGLGQLFTRNWFNRLWVIQEVVSSGQAIFLCGNQVLDYGLVTQIARRARLRGLHSYLGSNGDFIPAFNSLNLQDNLRRLHQGSSPDDAVILSQILLQSRPLLTTEPIDKAYAVLGLVSHDCRAQIRVDYSAESRRNYCFAYIQLCHQMLQARLGHQVLTHAVSRHRPGMLPSWCPNLDAVRPDRSFFTSVYHAGGQGDVLVSHVATSIDRMIITLRGYETEQVHEVVPSYRNTSNAAVNEDDRFPRELPNLEWIESALAVSRAVQADSTMASQSVLRTLIADLLLQPIVHSPPITELEPPFHLLRLLLAGTNTTTDPQEVYSRGTASGLWQYARRLADTCYGRSFFSTTAGRVGVGPADIKSDDVVVVFEGCPLPLILRKQNASIANPAKNWPRHKKGSRLFKLVGEAFVHGIMDGAVFDAGVESTVEEKLFDIT